MFPKIVLVCSLSCVLATFLDSVEDQNESALMANNTSGCLNQTIELLMNDDDIRRLQTMIKAKKHAEKKAKAHLCVHQHPSDCPHKQQHYPLGEEILDETTKALEMTLAHLTSDIDTMMSTRRQARLELDNSASEETPGVQTLREILTEDTVDK